MSHIPRRDPDLILIRNVLLAFVAICVFLQIFGMPHLRVSYQYVPGTKPRVITSAKYWSPRGMVHSYGGVFGEGCPLVVLIPLEKPVIHLLNDWREEFNAR